MAENQALTVTPRQQELFDLRDFYRGDEWRAQDLLFLSQALMLSGLPYKQLKERSCTRTLTTSKGPITITLKAIKEGVPLPFGKDRVVLACALTKARQKKRRWVSFDELEEILSTFGEDYQKYGGEDYERIQNRWDRLNWCVITIRRGAATDKGNDTEGDKKFIISKYRFPKRKRGPKTAEAQPKEATDEDELCAVQFGADFWEDYIKYCVPMPIPLMRLFADQPKAWDISVLVHWASHSAIASKRLGGAGTKKFTMSELVSMIGTSDSNQRRLRETIKQVLAEIKTVWPEVNAQFDDRGNLVVGIPTAEKLLVQPSASLEQTQALVEDSATSGTGQKVDVDQWIQKFPGIYRRFLKELKLMKEASVGSTGIADSRHKCQIAAERVGMPLRIAEILATQN